MVFAFFWGFRSGRSVSCKQTSILILLCVFLRVYLWGGRKFLTRYWWIWVLSTCWKNFPFANIGHSLLWAWSYREIQCDLHNKEKLLRGLAGWNAVCPLAPLQEADHCMCVNGAHCYSQFEIDFRWEKATANSGMGTEKLRLRAELLCLFNVICFHLGWKLWFLALDQCQQVCSNWLLMTVRYCTACKSYLLLFHWSFSFGASELVCTVVILFALLLAPVRMESITGRMCVREAKSECITLIKSTVCD